MIDIFALVLTHGLMLFAVVRLLQRDELDREDGAQQRAEQDKSGA